MGMGGKEEKQKEELYKEKECKEMKSARASLSCWLSAQSKTECQETEKRDLLFVGGGGDAMEVINPTFQIDTVDPLPLQ